MADVQCPNSKCTAERKGFRLKLDSWRHKLIHCVGFESILEGIYGPLLLKDISIFDDCEPEESDNWSMDATCSFCTLQLDKLGDHVPVATSPLSSPSDEMPSQAPSFPESNQSAHRFLYTVFHKKDVPLSSGDPNVPLVAQELMKKMIHQFALEYASKSPLYTTKNGYTTALLRPGPPDPDAPLDLTVSKTQESHGKEPQPEGVLDLSKRASALSAPPSLPTNQNLSGLQLPTVTEEIQHEAEDAEMLDTLNGCKSALQAVLQMLCPVHRSLLQQILTVAFQEHRWAFSCTHHQPTQAESYCCHRAMDLQDSTPPSPSPFNESNSLSKTPTYDFSDCNGPTNSLTTYLSLDCNAHSSVPFTCSDIQAPSVSGCCCVQSCRMAAFPGSPVCLCLKSLQCLSCQSLAIGRINKVVCTFMSSSSLCPTSKLCPTSSGCPTSTICCSSSHNLLPCPCYSEHNCLVKDTAEGSREISGGKDPQCSVVLARETSRSPSPPPLSPIPSDINGKAEEKPPSLQHHRDEGEDVKDHYVESNSQQGASVDVEIRNYPECKIPEQSHAEQNQSGSLLQDVVDRFSEKLETIKPQEKDPPPLTSLSSHSFEKGLNLCSLSNQSLESQKEAHLNEIITTCLYPDNNSDYNLSDLFHNANQSPKTRFRLRKEALAAMTKPPDQPSTRRHTLEIKRELARLDPNNCWRKRSLGRSGKSKDGSAVASPPVNSSCETSPVKDELEGIRKNNIVQLEKMPLDWENTRVREEEEVEKIPIEEIDTPTEERGIERRTQNVVKSTISEVVEMKKEDGQVVSEEESIERLRKESQWNRVTSDEGKKSFVVEEVKTVIVTEEVKMEILTEDEGKEMANMEERTPMDNQMSSTTWQKNTITEIDVKDESETPSGDQARGHYLPEIPRTHKELLTPSHDNDSCTRTSGQSKRTRPERKDAPMSIQVKSRRNMVQRSRRQIVPPQRFSSYVTEPRKMYFAACFSESIFSQRTSKDRPDSRSDAPDSQTASNNVHKEREEPLHSMPHLERQENDMNASECLLGKRPGSPPIVLVCQSVQVTVPSADKSSPKHFMPKRTDVRESGGRANGRLQYSPTKRQNSASKLSIKSPKKHSKEKGDFTSDNTTISVESQDMQYISPIKLMFVSPVGEDGVRYTLRSAASGSNGQGEETFDPCESSSWAGTPEKNKSPTVEHIVSPPKRSPTKSGEGSPPKQAVITDTYRSIGLLNGISGERQDGPLPFHETTLKRRPGRPKKLGPQLEKREKRPIGRPPKQKCLDQSHGPGTNGASVVNPKGVPEPDVEDKPNKNLKITVVYGRSRRSKRLVLEDSGLLQTSMNESPTVVSTNAHVDKKNLFQENIVKDAPLIVEDLNFVRPVKDGKEAPHSSSNIKCQKLKGAVPMRKPGRPAKVKISGISVTVTTVSPRQRKIHINRDPRESPQRIRKKLLPEFQPSKDPKTISVQTSNDDTQTETKQDSKDEEEERKERPVPVRHSVRVRKPSVYLLHSVATSRSYSHSTALLRRSRQLLLNKASSQRKLEEAQGGGETSGEKPHLFVQAGKWNERKQVCQDLSHVAGVSMDSIFPQSGTLKWWAVSTQEKTLNQELARRIRLVSETWISDTHSNQEKTSLKTRVSVKASSTSAKRPEPMSMVRMLFDCPPTKPRSCSMGQLCSWFMQTTETQSLAIVKKASTRNPYEVMHYPRVTNRGSVSPSPQAERLRKHVKKFATAVPKSPTQHRQAQERLWFRSRRTVKHQLFASTVAPGRLRPSAQWWKGGGVRNYLANLLRVKSKFLTRRERVKRPKRQTNHMRLVKRGIPANKLPEQVKFSLKSSGISSTATERSFDDLENIWPVSPAHLTEEMSDIPKEQRLSSKAWSPETLKECKVFLKKINSPDTESTAEEDWDTCTVTLDDGSPSAYCPDGGRVEGREREEDNKAVKMQRRKRMKKRRKTKESESSSLSEMDQDGVGAGIRKGKVRSFEKVSSESLVPSPAKVIRQSRGRGLTGLRWRDFVVGSSK